jgi:two-component system chemotaxis sensor kinase CheA
MNEDDPLDLIEDYVAECTEHLATIEADLLAIEASRGAVDERLVNRVFRAAHSIKGGAGVLGLVTIRQLAHQTENTLDWIRSGRIAPTPEVISVLLRSFDVLRDLICNYRESDRADIAGAVAALTALTPVHCPAQEAL